MASGYPVIIRGINIATYCHGVVFINPISVYVFHLSFVLIRLVDFFA
jgi:hypothetical protein